VIHYSGLKFPHRAVVVLWLESDGALCKKKCSVGFSVFATKPAVTENNICEGTDCLKVALSSGVTGLQVMVASAASV
jgi:hypothetical protein